MYGNAELLILAGSETTASLLAGATYFLATHEAVMSRLTQEVQKSFASEDEIDMLSVDKLPYLCAVTEECLRMFPPAVNAQPRITPPEGNVILGERIPGNVSNLFNNSRSLNLMIQSIDCHRHPAPSHVPGRKTVQGCE